MKKIEMNTAALDPFFKSLEKLTLAQRLLICFGSILLLAGAFYMGFFKPSYDKISSLTQECETLEKQLAVSKKKAMGLEKLKVEMAEKEALFNIIMKALPDKKEIPSLLANISQSGQKAGLDFLQFQPGPEVMRDFFADIPVKIKVVGAYHNLALFFDDVSNLSRIVNIKDIKIGKTETGKGGGAVKDGAATDDKLNTECMAVTYRFVEAPPLPETDPKKTTTNKK